MIMRKFFACSAIFAGCALASAGPIGLGGVTQNSSNGAIPFTPLFTDGDLTAATAYTVPIDSMTVPMVGIGDHYTGTITSSVWRNPITMELAFEYSFRITGNTGPSPFTPAHRATIGGNWSGATVYDAGSSRFPSGLAGSSTAMAGVGGPGWTDGSPLTLSRSLLGQPQAEFAFLPFAGTTIGIGESSAHFWFATNALTYSTAQFNVLDSGVGGQGSVFVVPAPGAVILGALGLAAVRGIRRRFSHS